MANSTFNPRRVLFRLEGCPYCQRAEAALDAAKISYEKLEISPSDRSVVKLLSGQSSVPVLVEVIGCASQDDDILAYIAARK
jgi:glutaredoxin